MKARIVVSLLLLAGAVWPLTANAQTPAPTPPKQTVTALMVEVTLSRHLGDKRLSSTPYTLSVIPENRASLRMGGDVPVPAMTFTPGQKEGGVQSYSYRNIGTSIDVSAGMPIDGQYRITLTIDESSIYPPELAPVTTKSTGAPAFRSFKSTNPISLRDGQSLEYTMATDRLTGEVFRVTVKLTVVK